jgi:hypothetical protein
MKITKSQLKQIIKEELGTESRESAWVGRNAAITAAVNELHAIHESIYTSAESRRYPAARWILMEISDAAKRLQALDGGLERWETQKAEVDRYFDRPHEEGLK